MDNINRSGGIDVDALIHALKDAVKEAVKDALKEQRTPDKPFTRRELIKHLGIGATTFDRIESRGEGPRKTKLSDRRICYMPEDVNAWQAKRKV
jgi:predicted DNA-binding transcriptional regulator AlpA